MAQRVKRPRRNIQTDVQQAVANLNSAQGSSIKDIFSFLRNTKGDESPTSKEVKLALKSAIDQNALEITEDGLYKARRHCGKSSRRRRLRRTRSRRSRRGGRCKRGGKRKSRRSRRKSRKGKKCRKSRGRRRSKRSRARRQKRKSRKGRKRRKCSRPCTRMWKPRRGGKRGKKCSEEDKGQRARKVDAPQEEVITVPPSDVKIKTEKEWRPLTQIIFIWYMDCFHGGIIN